MYLSCVKTEVNKPNEFVQFDLSCIYKEIFSMFKISIPTPCHENWETMTPDTAGRYCSSCAKTVIDFTSMSDEEIKYFFIRKKEEKVCGRFRNEQLGRITIELPHNIFHVAIPYWKKFLAASLLVFSTTLFSCNTKLKEKPASTNNKIDTIQNTIIGKRESSVTIGNLAPTAIVPDKHCTKTFTTTGTPSVITGDTIATSVTPKKTKLQPFATKGEILIIDTTVNTKREITNDSTNKVEF